MAWWAIYTEPRREFLAKEQLEQQLGVEVFLPFERVTRRDLRVRGAHKPVRTYLEPVFPRYLFADASEAGAGWVNAVRGVMAVVNSVGRPLEVPGRVVDTLRGLAAADGQVAATFHAKVGDRFVFRNRPFEGLIGRLASVAELDETGMVKVWLNILGGEREIPVPYGDIGRVVRGQISNESVPLAA